MEDFEQHWENIFQHKSDKQKSWYESYPTLSIAFIERLQLPKDAAIIDVGGGDSRLVDALLEKGYSNITVLDISATAIENTKRRLDQNAQKINWIVGDILEFHSDLKFDLWHDRAAFHFLIAEDKIKKYVQLCETNTTPGGYLIVGTFSEKGPEKCSGLDVRRYSEASMSLRFEGKFERIKCVEENHITPFKTRQSFLFCSFKKMKN